MKKPNLMEQLALTAEIDDLESEFCQNQLRESAVAASPPEPILPSLIEGLQNDLTLLKHDFLRLTAFCRNGLTVIRRRWLRFSFGALSVVVLLAGLNGCATVKPYERENLADRVMDFDSKQEEDAMELHFLLTREGSIGGYGGAGGGCACN